MTNSENIVKAIETHLTQWHEISKRLQNIVVPVLMQQEQQQRVIQPFVETQKALHKALKPIVTTQEKVSQALSYYALPKCTLPNVISEQIENFRKSFEGIISPAFENLQRSFKELPPRTQEALLLLGRHGWYLDLNMPIPSLWDLKMALEEGKVQKVEDALIQYFENHLDDIETSIVKIFPSRKQIIQAAFKAHRRQEYELSIPVFLSQTDGICKEVVGEYFFIKQNKKPRTALYIEQIAADTFRAALLSPLAQTLPISASEKERDVDFGELNRHMVLHGDSLDYGTRRNSIKAISLIT